jgi:beta-galactosidase
MKTLSFIFFVPLFFAFARLPGDVIWLEGETFQAETAVLEKDGRENFRGGGKGYETAGWGNTELISGGRLLHVNLSGNEARDFLPPEGLVFSHEFEVGAAGTPAIWARIGYEFARSPFDWRINDGAWQSVSPETPTEELQSIQTWNELGWLNLGTHPLPAGKHRISFRHRFQPVAEGGKPERVLHMLDAVCISTEPFRPFGKWQPGQDHRSERDRAAETHVFSANTTPGPDGRAWTELNGLWQVAGWNENVFPIPEETRLQPVRELPELDILRWKSYRAPGAVEEQHPELAHTHRFLLRTRVDVPASAAGRGFFLDVQRSTLILSVFVNGEYVDATDIFHTAWQMDLSRHIRPGQVNEIVIAVKNAYYSLNPGDDALGSRRYWNIPREFLKTNQGTAARHDYPVAADVRGGILEPASLVMTGPVYAADVFAIPQEGKLGLEITLFNPTANAADVELSNEVLPWNEGQGGAVELRLPPRRVRLGAGASSVVKIEKTWDELQAGVVELRFPVQRVRLAAGESRVVKLEQAWANPTRWWPDNPHLYWVRTRIGDDVKLTRFGFRTIDWSTDQFKINGTPWQMWADVSSLGRDPREQVRVAREQSHANQTRYWHNGGIGGMTRRQAMAYFDETGMLVRSSGTFDGQVANYGGGLRVQVAERQYAAKQPFWDNWRRQLTAWVREERNNPSIYIWSVENEIAYINSNNLGQYREVEPELSKGVKRVMEIDPTRPGMVDGGNALRDESLPVNGAHYTEFMNVTFRDFPDAAYTLEHFFDPARPQRGAWRKVPGRPIMGGEVYYANGYDPADFATIGGDRAFIGIGETMAARDLWAKMLSEGYRWSGYASWHFWLVDAERSYWNSWKPVALFSRQWNWTWGSGATITRDLKLFNTTSDESPIEALWELHIDGKRVAGESREFRLPRGGAEEFAIRFQVPSVEAPARGTFLLSARRGGVEVYREEKPLRILSPGHLANPPIQAGEMAVYDPAEKLSPFLCARNIPFAAVTAYGDIPSTARFVVVGPDAIAPDQATDPLWMALAAQGRKVLVLDQANPLSFRGLPGDFEPTRNTGRIGFAEDLTHPAFAGLEQPDFFTWGNGHVVYRNAYRKGTTGGRSLFQCDNRLTNTALIESEINDGLLLISQLAIGDNLAQEAVAQQMLLNLLTRVATHSPVRKESVVVLPEGDRRTRLLQALNLRFTPEASVLAALRGDGIAIVDATPLHLRTLAENQALVDSFQDRGGWLMLWGLEPEGLEDFNRLVRHNHVLRRFGTERVLLNIPQDSLAAGLTLRDVVMDTGRALYNFMALKAPDQDAFRWLVDHTDIAPFATFPDGLAMGKGKASPGGDHETRNLVNGFTSDDNWVFTYTTILDQGHATRIPLELPKEEEISSLLIRPSRLYHPITKMNIYFDDDPVPVVAEIPVREQPIVEEIPIPGRLARKVTLEIAGWGERGDKNIVVLDNLWLRVKRSDDYLSRVSSLLNVGALMAYRRGSGGIFLNQIYLPENEVNPDNAGKKMAVVKSLLANMGGVFEGARLDVERVLYQNTPLEIDDNRFNIHKDQARQPAWFGGGDIGGIPVGRRSFAGVEFALSDVSTSPVPSVMALAGDGSPIRDNAINGIPVNAKADVLHFLHTFHAGRDIADWQRRVSEAESRRRDPPAAPQVATYRVHYEDGSREEIPVVFLEHVGAWDMAEATPLPSADLGWTGRQANGASASVWKMTWRNPHPEKTILRIDFLRQGRPNLGAPALFSISLGTRVP